MGVLFLFLFFFPFANCYLSGKLFRVVKHELKSFFTVQRGMNDYNLANAPNSANQDINPSYNQAEEKTAQGVSVVAQASPLLALPNELLLEISSYLSLVERTPLALTSKRFNAIFNTEERLKALCDQYYGPPDAAEIYRKNIVNREIPAVPHHDISDPLLRLAYHRYVSNKYLASLEEGTIENCLVTIKKHTDGVIWVAPMPGGRLASCHQFTNIKVWDLSRLDERPLTLHKINSRACVVIPLLDGRLASCHWCATIKVWDLTMQRCVATLYGHCDIVSCITQLPDGRLVSCSFDKTIKVWDLRLGGKPCVATLTGHTDIVMSITLLPDGRLASCSRDKTVRIWDLSRPDGRRCVATLQGPKARTSDWAATITAFADGRLIAFADNLTIWVLDLTKPHGEQCVAKLDGHMYVVHTVRALADGRLVSCSHGGMIKVWDLSKPHGKRCVATLNGRHNGWWGGEVWTVAELDDGQLVSWSEHNGIMLWDLTGEIIKARKCSASDFSLSKGKKSCLIS